MAGDALERDYLRAIAPEQSRRMRLGTLAAMTFDVLLMVAAGHDLPKAQFNACLVPMGVAFAGLAVAFGLTFVQRLSAVSLLFLLSALIAWAVGMVSAATGGYASPLLFVILLIWIFGAAIVHLSPRQFVFASILDVPIAFACIETAAPTTELGLVPCAILSGGYIYSVVGCALRFRGEVAAFSTQQRLAMATVALDGKQRELTSLNSELATRVADQVHEITRRAKETEQLNLQLQQRVQERSRELAAALHKLEERTAQSGRITRGEVVAERYEVMGPLGQGGMGAVFKAHDRKTDAVVAIKLIHASVAKGATALKRMLVEAEAAARVSHPAIIRTLDVDVTEAGQLYLAMEYVEGESLDRVLSRGRPAVVEVCRLVATISDALSAAHAADVVHRDVKPANIMVCKQEPGAKLLDFGLAKRLDEASASEREQLTQDEQVLGTPQYFSPEASASAPVGSSSDVYSLGVVMFEMLAGRLPFEARTPVQWVFAHAMAPPPRLRDIWPDTPDALCDLVASCLSKKSEQRPTAAELRDRLTVWLEARPDLGEHARRA